MTLDINKLTVTMKAQGVERDIAVGEYPEETIAYWITYGVRRAYQDAINSGAKALRDEGKTVDGDALFEARDKTFREATMGTRADGTGLDIMARYTIQAARGAVKAKYSDEYKALKTATERDMFVWEKVQAAPEATQKVLAAKAEELREAAEAEREAAKELATTL